MCYQLPRFHAEAEVGWRCGFPAFGNGDPRRLVKRRLQLNSRKVDYVASLGLGPAAATDKGMGFYHSDQPQMWLSNSQNDPGTGHDPNNRS
jgi:hypothetical protein